MHLAKEYELGLEHFFMSFDSGDLDIPDKMVSFNIDVEATNSMTMFLTLSTLTPRVNTKEKNHIMDFSMSIMLTSNEYMATVEEFQEVKINTAKEKERLREEKEERKERKVADKEEKRLAREAQAI